MNEKHQFIIPAVIFAVVVSIVVGFLAVRAQTTGWIRPQAQGDPALYTDGLAQIDGGAILNTGGAPTGLIVANGNVGIGTPSPSAKLDVVGDANATRLCINGACQSSWPSGGASYSAGTGISISGTTISSTGLSCVTRVKMQGVDSLQTLYSDARNGLRVTCSAPEFAAGGMCAGVDVCSGGDTTNHGGHLSGRALECPEWSCTNITADAQCCQVGDDAAFSLINNAHTRADCNNAGGSVIGWGSSTFCRFDNASSCPAGWSQYNNWSTTKVRTYAQCAGSGDCASSYACQTGSHSFRDASQETCTYRDAVWAGYVCDVGASYVCSADKIAVGCF